MRNNSGYLKLDAYTTSTDDRSNSPTSDQAYSELSIGMSKGQLIGINDSNDCLISATTPLTSDDPAAAKATEFEHNLNVADALKLYKKAVFWSFVVSLTIIMDGYDGALIGGLFAQPAFQKHYGVQLPDGSWSIPAFWQTVLGMGAPIGRVVGGLGVSFFVNIWGSKLTLIGSLILTSLFLFIVFYSTSIQMLSSGFILNGIMWGVFNTVAPTYASEVCPVSLRGILTAYINLAWVIGQFINQCVMNRFVEVDTEWAYRIPFAIQWVWPGLTLLLLPFAPESPWWLVRKDRIEDARRSLYKLTSLKSDEMVNNQLAMIIETDKKERKIDNQVGWMDCFKGVNRRRTEIACMAWSCQALCGNPLLGYSAYFFEMAGLQHLDAFKLALGLSLIGIAGTVTSWFVTGKFGRRASYLWGLSTIATFLFLMGAFDLAKKGSHTASFAWAQSILLLLLTFVYDLTIGPVAFIVVSEVSAIRLREKTIALATSAYSVWGVIFQILTPYMLNPEALNWSGKVGFLFGSLCLLSLIWAYFRLPEMSGRTFAEIDHMFKIKLPAIKFKDCKFSYNVESDS